MNSPHAHYRSLPPRGGRCLLWGGPAGEIMNDPHAHYRSLPPKGADASFGAALQEKS
jgi:hypothetical protein